MASASSGEISLISSFCVVVLDSAGKIDQSMMPNGVGADAVTLVAGEALVAGNFVYINGSGQVMKADATAIGKKAVGYLVIGMLILIFSLIIPSLF